MLKNYFEMFNGKSEVEQLDVIEELLLDAGYEETVVNITKGNKTIWFSKEGVDNIFALSVRYDGDYLPIILPKEFAEEYYSRNGKFFKGISIGYHSNKDGKLVAKYDSDRLHRVILRYYGVDVNDNLEVDHITNHQGINIREELRVCTSKQNKANKINTKVKCKDTTFSYNEEHDFRNSFYIPLLHYVLGVISYDDMHELRRMEIMSKAV